MSVVKKLEKAFMFANYTPADKSIGITKKIGSEIDALRRMGMRVTYTAYDGDGVSIFDDSDHVIYHKAFPTPWAKINRKIRYFWLEKTAVEYLGSVEGFDLGYIRIGAPNGALFQIFRLLKGKGARIVAESLAYFPGIQYKSLFGKYIVLMYRLNDRRFKDYLDYFLVEGNLTELHGVEAVPMNMGVEVDKIHPHQYMGESEALHLISVANENVYHGYDRIIKSLNTYLEQAEDKRVYVHLVGTVSDETKELVKRYGLEDHVFLYGKKSGAELDEIYNKCNVGLGPFGQHRVGGKKDTGLKTKEYFAKGLPYIYSGSEPTVPEGYPYICAFASDESLIDFEKVRSFYNSYRDDPMVVERMRTFAGEHYSWDTIMRGALSHLE